MRSVRSFIAIECPEGIKKAIQEIQQELKMALGAYRGPLPGKSEPLALPERAQGQASGSAGDWLGHGGIAREANRPPYSNRLGASEERSPHGPPHINISWVRPEGFHLTLKFLGQVDENRLSKIREIVGEVVTSFSPFTIRIEGVGVFPNAKTPRVIWIAAKSAGDDLVQLQGRVEEVLDPLGFPREGRPFHPHLTLCRIKSERKEVDFRPIRDALAKWLAENRQKVCGQFEAIEVLLIKSDLQPGGAVYTPLVVLKLGLGSEQTTI